MKDKLIIGNEKNILFYNDENGNTKVEVLLENEDVWLNTEALASLFNIDRSGIVRHINNIYKDEEHKPVVNDGPKVGRNDPCPCGSGKKYKNCCGKNQ